MAVLPVKNQRCFDSHSKNVTVRKGMDRLIYL